MKKKTLKTQNKEEQVKKPFYYPSQLIRPVTLFLQSSLKLLERRKKEIGTEDPFKDTTRLANNASPDSDAEEQYGHARTSAIRDELNKKIIQTRKALTMIKLGKYGICEDCGKMIDTDRLMVFPETTLCANDAKKREK
jgi:RNA polymerase-binding transcription factor DksA